MIYSMTAFVRSQNQLEAGQLCWEIRSLNHRYLDVTFRLPESFRFLENHLRSALKGRVNRGKLECQLKYQETKSNDQSLVVNIDMVNTLVNISTNLSLSHHLANDLGISTVLAWPGVVQSAQFSVEELGKEALQLFQQAIEQLSQVRAVEGSALKAQIIGRSNTLKQLVVDSQSKLVALASQAKNKLLSRLKTVQLEIPELRVEQEIALILARLDVSEELDRLTIHLEEVARTLECDDIAGRRLDFLMQELNREANTLSSKSDSIDLIQNAVAMKVLIEQMREQIQNIE